MSSLGREREFNLRHYPPGGTGVIRPVSGRSGVFSKVKWLNLNVLLAPMVLPPPLALEGREPV